MADAQKILSVDKLLQTIGGLLLTICLGIATWALSQISDLNDAMTSLDKRITTIEANRFTVKDGADMRKSQADTNLAVAKIQRDIASQKDLLIRIERSLEKLKR